MVYLTIHDDEIYLKLRQIILAYINNMLKWSKIRCALFEINLNLIIYVNVYNAKYNNY